MGSVACLLLTTVSSAAGAEPHNNSAAPQVNWADWQLVPSSDGRRIDKANGEEWFYMADTAWSLFLKLDREEADTYLKNRRDKGFSVIQAVAVMGYNTGWNTPNAYGHRPFIDGDPTRPDTGGDANYWSHVDWVINKAKEYGLYVMLTPAWGSSYLQGDNVGRKELGTQEKCKSYATFIGNRYKDYPNIIWMNGGDSSPKEADRELFNTIGNTIKSICKKHLMGYHGHGFHNGRHCEFIEQDWSDFANYYSGHFTSDFSDLNYRLVLKNWENKPAKPIFDTEPAYEGLPKNIAFNPQTGYFEARDARRRAYWSVMAGAAGHAFGNNDVHLFADEPFQGMRYLWKKGMDQPAAAQMGYLRKLMLSRSRKGLVADPSLIHGQDPVEPLDIVLISARYGIEGDITKQMDLKQQIQKKLDASEYRFQITNELAGRDPAYGVAKTLTITYKLGGKEISETVKEFGYPFLENSVPYREHRHIQACRTRNTAWYYTYTGSSFTAALGKIEGDSVTARWFNPRDGKYTDIGAIPNRDTKHFDPPGSEAEGNDWVLELTTK